MKFWLQDVMLFCFRHQCHTRHGSLQRGVWTRLKQNQTPHLISIQTHTDTLENTHLLCTHTHTAKNAGGRPAEAWKVLRCAYERARGARFLYKPLCTRCATCVNEEGLGHALKSALHVGDPCHSMHSKIIWELQCIFIIICLHLHYCDFWGLFFLLLV